MKKLHGISASRDGCYTKVTITRTTNSWKILRTESWEFDNAVKVHTQFNDSLHLAIECRWIRSQFIDLETHATTSRDNLFCACTQPAPLEHHRDNLGRNLLGIYPDDIFLCTIPLHMSDKVPSSFLALYEEEHCWKTGIIIDKKLLSAYSVPKLEDMRIGEYLARLERYWTTLKTGTPFPRTVFLFNNQNAEPGESFTTRRVKTGTEGSSAIKALGTAFCSMESTQPSFCGPTPESKFMKTRTMVYCAALLLLVLCSLSCVLSKLIENSQSKQISTFESEYKKILTDNKEIRDLFANGEMLSEKLTRIDKFSSNPTRWSQFLHLLGTSRPPKLYFERLASDPVKSGNSNKVRILLAGWAESETVVTELIKRLNSSELISNTTLSSMERDEKQKDFCKFKIVCTLTLSKN